MAMDSAGVEIRVQPDILNAKAEEVSGAIAQMEQLFESVQATAARTKYYWIGEAGELHRKMFEDQKDDIVQLLQRLKEHPVDLQKIAKTYTETEQQLTEAASLMSSNLID
ncbi:MAG: WXG100 family type VII secretion target [Lachnospiraceae bacterium]|nr:WXG100 family type VII secretion target [Lachnospiraceae bacterium]